MGIIVQKKTASSCYLETHNLKSKNSYCNEQDCAPIGIGENLIAV